ncbi:MAG TPA: NUDIX domain-containing protein [Clostridiales bacterium]|nr:NUDIX domain-containing protein [Clostridiales bacterium]
MVEQWDIYDHNRMPTGRIATRGKRFLPGEYHLVVHVCIFDSRNRMLIQQRQRSKSLWSELWDVSVGGSAQAGEDSRQAAQREAQEEIGLRIDLGNERPHLSVPFDWGYDDYFSVTMDVDINALTLQAEEVQAVRWATQQDIELLLRQGQFIPYQWHFIPLLFELHQQRGTIRKPQEERK